MDQSASRKRKFFEDSNPGSKRKKESLVSFHVLIKISQRKLKFIHYFSLDRTGRGNTPRRSPRLSLAREKLRTKLFGKLHDTKRHALVDNRNPFELNVLQNLK